MQVPSSSEANNYSLVRDFLHILKEQGGWTKYHSRLSELATSLSQQQQQYPVLQGVLHLLHYDATTKTVPASVSQGELEAAAARLQLLLVELYMRPYCKHLQVQDFHGQLLDAIARDVVQIVQAFPASAQHHAVRFLHLLFEPCIGIDSLKKLADVMDVALPPPLPSDHQVPATRAPQEHNHQMALDSATSPPPPPPPPPPPVTASTSTLAPGPLTVNQKKARRNDLLTTTASAAAVPVTAASESTTHTRQQPSRAAKRSSPVQQEEAEHANTNDNGDGDDDAEPPAGNPQPKKTKISPQALLDDFKNRIASLKSDATAAAGGYRVPSRSMEELEQLTADELLAELVAAKNIHKQSLVHSLSDAFEFGKRLLLYYKKVHKSAGKTAEWVLFLKNKLGISAPYARQLRRLCELLSTYPGLLDVPVTVAELSRCAKTIKDYLAGNAVVAEQ